MSSSGESKSVSTSSYLTGAISSLSNWSSRSNTPKPTKDQEDRNIAAESTKFQQQRGGDHSVSHTHRLSWRQYPKDCPRLEVRWFHAVDVPKRKPEYSQTQKDDKPSPPPKKWSAFSVKDSKSVEAAFQKLLEEDERREQDLLVADETAEYLGPPDDSVNGRGRSASNASIGSFENSPVKVPVNEDYLFDVEIRSRELGPVYWLGPVYEVRRGSWFYIDGSTLRPCDENLAAQLEEGYLKTKPWKCESQSGLEQTAHPKTTASEKSSVANEVEEGVGSKTTRNTASTQAPLLTHRLFGRYINTVVTFQDNNTAWLLSDDFLSRMSGTVYQRFAGGAHFSGTKVVRGYSEQLKKKNSKDKKEPLNKTHPDSEGSEAAHTKDQSSSPSNTALEHKAEIQEDGTVSDTEPQPETKRETLVRQMSSLVASSADAETIDEEAREREMREIRDEYRENPDEEQDREIDHLILCTHGIGQRLGVRFETFNFIQDVNALRKTMKTVYSASPDLQALNSEVDKTTKNCRVQVIPISWRHQLDFPMEGVKQTRKEHDIADLDAEEQDKYPTLEDITVEGVPALRTIVSDLALDVLLYQTPAYNKHVSKVVLKECNSTFKLFKERNPGFKGKVSLIGHSLGSAIMFDLLCEQASSGIQERIGKSKSSTPSELSFNFDVDSFFCFGSPIGLFQMLNGKKIAGRGNPNLVTLDGFTDAVEDPFQDSTYSKIASGRNPQNQNEAVHSSPKCGQIYNIFHPTDPISYRLEPLISSAMATLKPQPLPYTKSNFFGPMGQGITGIPAKVGQSFSGLWQGFTSGIADSLIQRSIFGVSPEDAAKIGTSQNAQAMTKATEVSMHGGQQRTSQSVGAGTNIVAGGVVSSDPYKYSADPGDAKKRRMMQDAMNTDPAADRQPTLIDPEIETLYSGFQKRRRSGQENDSNLRDFGENPVWQEAESRARKLKREEAKVRALNGNGRVDYSIQEGAFDISFLASIASHLTYWTDEDVCHFLMSQLLSRRISRRSTSLRKD